MTIPTGTPSISGAFADELEITTDDTGTPKIHAQMHLSVPKPVIAAIADKDMLHSLDDTQWSDSGVYILLWPFDPQNSTTQVYVGKSASTGGVKARLASHSKDSSKTGWTRAIALKSATQNSWDEAEVAWLENNLYSKLKNTQGLTVTNQQEPSTGRLKSIRQQKLHGINDVAVSLLALSGSFHRPSVTKPKAPTNNRQRPAVSPTRSGKKAQYYGVTIEDMLRSNTLSPGATLESTQDRYPAKAVITPNGHIRITEPQLPTAENIDYPTPSAAAVAVPSRRGMSCNGWTYWKVTSVIGGPTLADLREIHTQQTQK